MEVKVLLLKSMATIVSISLVSLIFIFTILKQGRLSSDLYKALLKYKVFIVTFLLILIAGIPLFGTDNLTQLYKSLLVYVKELLYSVFFVVLFTITWRMLNKKLNNNVPGDSYINVHIINQNRRGVYDFPGEEHDYVVDRERV